MGLFGNNNSSISAQPRRRWSNPFSSNNAPVQAPRRRFTNPFSSQPVAPQNRNLFGNNNGPSVNNAPPAGTTTANPKTWFGRNKEPHTHHHTLAKAAAAIGLFELAEHEHKKNEQKRKDRRRNKRGLGVRM